MEEPEIDLWPSTDLSLPRTGEISPLLETGERSRLEDAGEGGDRRGMSLLASDVRGGGDRDRLEEYGSLESLGSLAG